MGDVGDYWRDAKEHQSKKKAERLSSADPTGWHQHTEYHWSRTVAGKKLDYWPSTGKFQYDGKVYSYGSVEKFIQQLNKNPSIDHLDEGQSLDLIDPSPTKIKERTDERKHSANILRTALTEPCEDQDRRTEDDDECPF